MKNIRVAIFMALSFICSSAIAQNPSTKTERKIMRKLQGNWIIKQNISDSTILLEKFNWTTENINNQFNYITFSSLDNKVKTIIIRTNSLWGCGTAEMEGQEYTYTSSKSVWYIKDGLLHIELKFIYQKKEFEINSDYTVNKQSDTLILNKQNSISKNK